MAIAGQPPERSILDLPAGELLVLGAMRAWSAPHVAAGAPHPDWRAVFRSNGLGAPAAVAFGELMDMLGGHAMRLVEVRCRTCTQVGPDEAAMLRLIAALQADGVAVARGILTDWLAFDAVEQGLRRAGRCAALLAAHGVRLALRQGPAHAARGGPVPLP